MPWSVYPYLKFRFYQLWSSNDRMDLAKASEMQKIDRVPHFTQNEARECLEIKSELNQTTQVCSPCCNMSWAWAWLVWTCSWLDGLPIEMFRGPCSWILVRHELRVARSALSEQQLAEPVADKQVSRPWGFLLHFFKVAIARLSSPTAASYRRRRGAISFGTMRHGDTCEPTPMSRKMGRIPQWWYAPSLNSI